MQITFGGWLSLSCEKHQIKQPLLQVQKEKTEPWVEDFNTNLPPSLSRAPVEDEWMRDQSQVSLSQHGSFLSYISN